MITFIARTPLTHEFIRSLKQQTRKRWRLIVAKKLTEKVNSDIFLDKRLMIISNDSNPMDYAKDYVCFTEGDAIYNENFIFTMRKPFSKDRPPVTVVYSPVTIISEDGDVLDTYFRPYDYEILQQSPYIVPAASIVKARAIIDTEAIPFDYKPLGQSAFGPWFYDFARNVTDGSIIGIPDTNVSIVRDIGITEGWASAKK